MFDQIKNRKGEKLYILTVVSTNNIMPHITVDTWKECKRKFEIFCKEDNSDRFFFLNMIMITILQLSILEMVGSINNKNKL